MKYGIISDVHANLEALREVLPIVRERTGRVVVLGDIVGYGPDPGECCKVVVSAGMQAVRGNHDEMVAGGDVSRLNETARLALDWTRERLAREWVEAIRSWPVRIEDEILFVHASPADPLFEYVNTRKDAQRAFASMKQDVCFIGHTHFPLCFRQEKNNGAIEMIPPSFSGTCRIQVEEGYRYLINAGSVGQPRDGIPAACAGIYDSTTRVFELFRVPYDAEVTSAKIRERGLPSSLGARLLRGL